MRVILAVLVYFVGSMAGGVSNAQQPTPPATPPNSPPEIIAPRQGDSTGNATGGVLHPPNVDPGNEYQASGGFVADHADYTTTRCAGRKSPS